MKFLWVAVLAFSLGFFANEYRHDQARLFAAEQPQVTTPTAMTAAPEITETVPAAPVMAAENMWSRINHLIAAQQYDEAIALLQQHLQTEPRSAQAWYWLAKIYQQQSKHRDAVAAWFHFLDYEANPQKIAEAAEYLKKYLIELHKQPLLFNGDSAWFIEQLNALLDVSANNSELHLLLAAANITVNDAYQAQYHALMALNDPATKKRAEDILAQLNGTSGADELSVPLTRYGNQYIVSLGIEGKPVRLLLDTGASISGLSTAFILRNPGLVKATKPILLNTANGAVQSYLFTVDSVTLGDVVFNQHMLSHLPMDSGNAFDGLLGVDILGRFDFVIDQNQAVLHLKKRH